jgi:hypothetical protein
MENTVIAGLVGIALFLAGVFFKDKVTKRKQVEEAVENAEQVETEGAANAAEKYEAKVDAIEAKAAAEIADRPTGGSPADILADRIRRHHARKRQRRQRDGSD